MHLASMLLATLALQTGSVDRLESNDGQYRLEMREHLWRLLMRGIPVWELNRPYRLQGASIGNDGTVAGFAYVPGTASDTSTFRVVLIRRDGKELALQQETRRLTKLPTAPPRPSGLGTILDTKNDWMAVRVTEAEDQLHERWWTYRVSTGEPLGKVRPKDEAPDPLHWIVRAEPVPGTPLILLNWWRYEKESGIGASFALVDHSAKPVWQLNLPGDYVIRGTVKEQDRLRDEMQTQGAILGVGDHTFEIREVSSRSRLKFSVKEGQNGWLVGMVSRSAFDPPTQAEVVQIPAPKPPSRRQVEDVLFTPSGDVVLLESGQPSRLTLRSPEGKLLASTELVEGAVTSIFHVGMDRFLCISGHNAFVVDARAGEHSPLPTPVEDGIESIAGFKDGSFVAVQRSARGQRLAMYAPDGKCQWRGPFNASPSSWDVTFDQKGAIVVIKPSERVLERYSRDGAFLRKSDLKLWTRAPANLHVVRDRADGFLISDGTTIWRTDLDGKLRSEMTPQFGTKPLKDFEEPRVDGVGRVWLIRSGTPYVLDPNGNAVPFLPSLRQRR